jgi:hypothetical protein
MWTKIRLAGIDGRQTVYIGGTRKQPRIFPVPNECFSPQTNGEKGINNQQCFQGIYSSIKKPLSYPDSIQNRIQRFLEYLSELSTFRINYPQF